MTMFLLVNWLEFHKNCMMKKKISWTDTDILVQSSTVSM